MYGDFLSTLHKGEGRISQVNTSIIKFFLLETAKPNVDPGTLSELTKSEFTSVKLALCSSGKKKELFKFFPAQKYSGSFTSLGKTAGDLL